MKQEIKFELISHASVLITSGNVSLLTDPWFGFPFHYNTFHLYPPFRYEISSLVKRVNVIHISHLHQDHFCKQSLSNFPKDILILISKYNGPYFLKELQKLGFTNIIEIKDDLIDFYQIGDLKIRTIQAESNETSFDSALLISDKADNHYLLANDCQFSESQLQNMEKILGQINGAFLSYTYVWPHPTCFSYPDQTPEKMVAFFHQKKMNDFEKICQKLKVGWAVPYANDLRFLKERLFFHNRIFDNHLPYPKENTTILKMTHGSVVNEEGVIVHVPQMSPPPPLNDLKIPDVEDPSLLDSFERQKELLRGSLDAVITKAKEHWKDFINVRFIIRYGKTEKTIDFFSDASEHPDLILKYDYEVFKLFFEGEINWIRLHTTYCFHAEIKREARPEFQPLLWRVT